MKSTRRACPVCGGPGINPGSLGRCRHYRCRDCGAGYSHTPTAPRRENRAPQSTRHASHA